jgi:hypothetical protein
MAEPRTPLERLAKLQATPVPKKMVPTVKPVSKPGQVDPNDPWGVLGTTTTSTSAATNVPGNKPFVGPTLDPEVTQARSRLKSEELKALQQGVAPGDVASIVAGKGDPNRGFLGPAKFVGNVIKGVGSAITPDVVPFTQIDISDKLTPVGKGAATVGLKALTAASPALNKLDFGRRLVVSTLKEVGDELAVVRGTRGRGVSINPKTGKPYDMGAGGFNVKDWWNQLSDESNITGGDIYSNVKNPYANQLLGFMTDVFLDPLTFASGPGGIAKTAVTRGTITGATRTGARIAARAATAEADQFGAALARKVAQDALDDAIRIGDNVAAEAAEDAIALANKQAAAAAKKLSGDAAGRTMGRTSNQALAGKVLGMRDEAQKVLDLGTAPADELAFAQRTVDVLNDEVIKNIQTSGLAGIAGPYIDIIRGVRTPAQDVLGVRGGIRFYNPLEVFGKGPLRVTVPGTERITNVAGKLLADSRLGLGNTALGAKVINNITPTGEGGILGSADLLEMRTGLRRGTLSPQEAQEATRLLELDQQYRALVNNERKVAAGALAQSGLGKTFDKETLNEVIRLRQTAAMAGTPVALNPTQQAAADAIDRIFDYFYDYAAKASGGTGYVPPRRTNYFPQMQSDEAIRWAQKFPKKAEELAKKLKVDRTWFVGNFRARDLAVGDEFFGKVLTQADIDGGVTALNNIARKWGLDFDYFDTDALSVIGKYAQKHAQFSALQKTIGSLPETLPSMAARKAGTEFQTPLVTQAPLPGGVGFSLADPATGIPLDPQVILQQLSKGELESLLTDVRAITSKLDPKVVNKKEIQTLVSQLDARLTKIEDDFINGAITPLTAAVATDEVVKLAKTVEGEVNNLVLDIASVPKTRWSEYADIVKKGFEILNDDIIDPTTGNVIYKGTAPDIAVREELADLLRNAERVKDPEFAARARQLALDYTRFSKAWLTARPGFHTRNALSNTYQLIAAGADPRNLITGNRILNRINRGLKAGLTPRQIATQLVDSKLVGVKEELFLFQTTFQNRRAIIDAIEDSINYSGATGFGQYGEIAAEVGTGNRGLLLKGGPANKVSRAIGYIPQGSRWLGEKIESYSRFGLMWDGMSKGLSPQEAAARANKYLIDYADLSNVDRVAKQIIPFWTFMSRNTPLQLELMWTNPRAYAFYSNLKRNIEDKEEQYIPSYEKERGVFAVKQDGFAGLLPGNLVKPGLPFPGGGDNVLQGLITEPKKFLASVNPAFRAPFEAFITGEKFFTGGKVVPKEWTDQATGSKLKYLVKELFAPASPVIAVLRAIPGVGRQKFMEDVFGLSVDEAEPLVQEVNSLISLLGLPVGQLRTEQQVREIESRIYDLGDRIDAVRNREKKAREENIQDNKTNVSNPDDPWGVLGP